MIAGGVIALWIVFGSFYRVDPQERGVVMRFGKYVETTGPGMHMKLPTPIDPVQKVPVETVSSIDIGSTSSDTQHLMLTGDQNIIRTEEHTSELQSLMRNSYAVFCMKKTTY